MADAAYIDRLLNFDGLAQAEDITGLSYKEDETTSSLGMLMHIENGKRKKVALQETHDTYWSMPFHEAVDVAVDLGFTPIYAQILPDNSRYGHGRPVHFYVYWNAGVLLVLESYGEEGTEHGLTLNQAHIWYNWRNKDGGTSWCPVNGSSSWTRMTPGFDDELEDDPWTMLGDKQVSEGLRHTLDLLHSSGVVLEEWAFTPRILSIHSYAEREEREGEDDTLPWAKRFAKLDANTVARIEQFDEPVRSMLLAGRRGKDWDDR